MFRDPKQREAVADALARAGRLPDDVAKATLPFPTAAGRTMSRLSPAQKAVAGLVVAVRTGALGLLPIPVGGLLALDFVLLECVGNLFVALSDGPVGVDRWLKEYAS